MRWRRARSRQPLCARAEHSAADKARQPSRHIVQHCKQTRTVGAVWQALRVQSVKRSRRSERKTRSALLQGFRNARACRLTQRWLLGPAECTHAHLGLAPAPPVALTDARAAAAGASPPSWDGHSQLSAVLIYDGHKHGQGQHRPAQEVKQPRGSRQQAASLVADSRCPSMY